MHLPHSTFSDRKIFSSLYLFSMLTMHIFRVQYYKPVMPPSIHTTNAYSMKHSLFTLEVYRMNGITITWERSENQRMKDLFKFKHKSIRLNQCPFYNLRIRVFRVHSVFLRILLNGLNKWIVRAYTIVVWWCGNFIWLHSSIFSVLKACAICRKYFDSIKWCFFSKITLLFCQAFKYQWLWAHDWS